MMIYDRSEVENSQGEMNTLRAIFLNININTYLQFLHIDITQVVEILPRVRQDI